MVAASKDVKDHMIWLISFLGMILKEIVQTGPAYPLSVLASFLASFISFGESFLLLWVIITVYANLGMRFTTLR